MPTLDWQAVKAGALVALVFAVPLSIGARLAADDERTGLAVALSIGAAVGFTIGGGCAAWIQRAGTPLSHGVVTAVATYTAAQVVFIVVRLIRGGDVRWFAAVFNLSVVAFAGLIGGLLGQRLQAAGAVPSFRRERKP